MDKESWKSTQFAFITKQSMEWSESADPVRYMNSLSIRNLSTEQVVWLKELAQETGMVEFSGHASPHGFVKGYRIVDFTQKTIEYYNLLKYKRMYLSQQEQIHALVAENTILRNNMIDFKLDIIDLKTENDVLKTDNDVLNADNDFLRSELLDCKEEFVIEKERVNEREKLSQTDLDNAVDVMLEKIKEMEIKLDKFIS
jgi:cell division protein FtsB